ncbi:MAG: hypothetical protein LLG14_18885 [Nocardiaceae bacterium]|nr:hypothetical protein [Nocardiaceae bacterium]
MRRSVIVAGIAVIAMISLIAVSLMPTTEKSYLATLSTAVEESRSAVLTVATVGETLARGDITSLAAHVTIEDALDDAQAALEKLVAEEVPTPHARELRDAAVMLLTTSTSLINDVATAIEVGDDDTLIATNAKLRALAGMLTGVLERAQ